MIVEATTKGDLGNAQATVPEQIRGGIDAGLGDELTGGEVEDAFHQAREA